MFTVVLWIFHTGTVPLFLQSDLSLTLVAFTDLPVFLSSFYFFFLSWNSQKECLVSPMAHSTRAAFSLKCWQVCYLGIGEQVMKRRESMRTCNKKKLQTERWRGYSSSPSLPDHWHNCEVFPSPHCISVVYIQH